MNNFLNDILEHKRWLVQTKAARYKKCEEAVRLYRQQPLNRFKNAIARPGQLNCIMELKKASPSKGIIREDFDLLAIARIYVNSGAAALSVLTEEKFFLGKPEYISELAIHVKIPLLTKDFILDEGQIYEAASNNASAVLLIVRMLNDTSLKHLMSVAKNLGMDSLVEVHDQAELDRALKAGAEIIGVNNRNLDTFVVDMTTSDRLIPQIVTAGKIAVVESGIKTHQDIVHVKSLGAHAVLIGETFMAAPDIGKKIKEILG